MAATRHILHFVVFAIVCTLCCSLTLAQDAHHNHHHKNARRSAGVYHRLASDNNSTNTDTAGAVTLSVSASEAAALLREARDALIVTNKARVENPHFNKNEFAAGEEETNKGSLAPPLAASASPNDALARRSGTSSSVLAGENNGTGPAVAAPKPYTITENLAEAARIVAECTPQVTTGDHAEVAAVVRAKYSHGLNDTNTPDPLKRPEGLLGALGISEEPEQAVLSARDSGYWMVDTAQLGSSPLAPEGYPVWRNVKNYGAVGDGKTDDTAAINLAISDGGRCGEDCGSSTKFPAVVYFPPGTYLVSSPLIQYHNTQFLGDPHNVPTILAASSFQGLGMITSDVYISDNEEWYRNTNNVLRSIRNFKLDIRLADPHAYICAIHWQVAQGTSLENIEFYSLYTSDVPDSNQQGIYMENGSGGFLADLTFVGGKVGAYFGNQQFTSSHLVFVNCETAVKVHWDWAWTMQDYIIESCGTGLSITGDAGDSDRQGVGSLVLADSIITNTPNGIVTTLLAENSTSFLLQNVGFFNVDIAVRDGQADSVLIAGGSQVVVENWGFGLVDSATGGGTSTFLNGGDILSMPRNELLIGAAYDQMQPNLFTRRRPNYYDVPATSIINVKALGAVGDGTADDTTALNSILARAANTSSVVYFPHGIYIITDTLKIPIGSRVIGQAWPQIMGRGPNFADELSPRPVVQVGRPGESGVIEIQDMLFTVSGPTAGAVVVEWNARESTQGSVGMWDSHIRVGGAAGSELQYEQCPKLSGSVNPDCKAASLLLHLVPGSSAYLENIWIWVADHDLDRNTQDQIDVYAARGLLIESDLAYLWGTASEHAVLYQYQLANASNILMSMIQAESPYFQPGPPAPVPFEGQVGMFSGDPTFSNCAEGDGKCAMSWALRILDSNAIYILGTGLYSWFHEYNQICVEAGDCQSRLTEVRESRDIWLFNICTKGATEMVSPLATIPTYAADNINGFFSSILAWLQGADKTSGGRNFAGFQLHTLDDLKKETELPSSCKSALAQPIFCDDYVQRFRRMTLRGPLFNETLTDSVCDAGCGASLAAWFNSVSLTCGKDYLVNYLDPMLYGGRLWAGYNETCLKDESSGGYCNDIIDSFSNAGDLDAMLDSEICSYCYIHRLAIMQSTPYSIYDPFFKSVLESVYSRCGLKGPTAIPDALKPPTTLSDSCGTSRFYVTTGIDTCDSIALAESVPSAFLYMANRDRIATCKSSVALPAGVELCMPPPCEITYVLQPEDNCTSIEALMNPDDVARFNSWVGPFCEKMQPASENVYGKVVCLRPQHGEYEPSVTANDTTIVVEPIDWCAVSPSGYSGCSKPPPDDATVAPDTVTKCGLWYVAQASDSCESICVSQDIQISMLLQVNPSLGPDAASCSNTLVPGLAYCLVPKSGYDYISDKVISTDGTCAGSQGFNCLESAFGDCCSADNLCGLNTVSCGVGCQEDFGACFAERDIEPSTSLP